jgi:hypothetical protein
MTVPRFHAGDKRPESADQRNCSQICPVILLGGNVVVVRELARKKNRGSEAPRWSTYGAEKSAFLRRHQTNSAPSDRMRSIRSRLIQSACR